MSTMGCAVSTCLSAPSKDVSARQMSRATPTDLERAADSTVFKVG